MDATTLIYIVGISIFSMAFIFMFLILKPVKVTPEKLTKVLGKENVEKIKNAKDVEDIKSVIMSLKKGKKIKLKTLAESQNLVDAVRLIDEVLLGGKSFASREKLKEIIGDLSVLENKSLEEITEFVKKLDSNQRARLQLMFMSMKDEEIAQKIKELV